MRAGAIGLAAAFLASAVPAARAAAQSAPGDSTLATACAGGGGLAEGLLLVVFRPDIPPALRATMVQEAGGTLAGTAAEAGPDGHYVTLPPEGRSVLDAAADRLIRLDGVESVGGVACPAPPTVPPDSAAADSAAPRPPSAPADTTRPADSADTR
jgi:hypothetical protein